MVNQNGNITLDWIIYFNKLQQIIVELQA